MNRFFTNKLYSIFFLLITCLVVLTISRLAWISDDALISFRTSLNFSNGLGLSYNVFERVQAFTNPFFVILLGSIYYFIGNIYSAFFIISFLSLCIYFSIIYQFLKINKNFLVTAYILFSLLLSKAFVEFSTSGLEESLSLALLSLGIYLLHKSNIFEAGKQSKKTVVIGLLFLSLASITRLDLSIFVLPILFFLFIKNYKNIYLIFYGFTPLFIWLLFSYFYYGDFFPNTFYAKNSTGYQPDIYLEFGKNYFKDSYWRDPITLLSIYSNLFLLLFYRTNKLIFSIFIGVFSYLIYIYLNGGTFFSGRFFYIPFAIAILGISICLSFNSKLNKLQFTSLYHFLFLFAFLFLILVIKYDLHKLNYTKWSINEFGPDDVRVFSKKINNDLNDPYKNFKAVDNWNKVSEKIKSKSIDCPFIFNLSRGSGADGLTFGPCAHMLDIYGLIDPNISALPALNSTYGRPHQPGHFKRAIPRGYLDYIVDRKDLSVIYNKEFRNFVKRSELITRDPLFDLDRINAIGYGLIANGGISNKDLWMNPKVYDYDNHVKSDWLDDSVIKYHVKGDLEYNDYSPSVLTFGRTKYEDMDEYCPSTVDCIWTKRNTDEENTDEEVTYSYVGIDKTYRENDAVKKYGEYNGKATKKYASGEKYVGNFKAGKYDGKGSLYFPNGGKYVGSFKAGKYDGKGTLKFPNDEKYVGTFKAGNFDKGTLKFPNGGKYVGSFKAGNFDKGTLKFPNGGKYVGTFPANQADMPDSKAYLSILQDLKKMELKKEMSEATALRCSLHADTHAASLESEETKKDIKIPSQLHFMECINAMQMRGKY